MKNSFKSFLIVILIIACPIYCSAKGNDDKIFNDLILRIIPQAKDHFKIKINPNVKDYFYLHGGGDLILIEANNINSAAYGLNWYLKNYCNSCISWCGDNINIPKELPKVNYKKSTSLTKNFYMNYCTFGYSTVYWDWDRWERELDIMALNGIKNPLAMVGVEVVWRNFLRKIGFSKDEILSFLCGPAHMPWLLMGNIENVAGKMPDEWFNRQEKLQKKIVQRMKDFDMEPIYQGFCGIVPTLFKKKFPELNVIEQGTWSRLKRPYVLLPTDKEFSKYSKIWYSEYNKLYGKANYYAGDLFHEGGSSDGIDLAECSKAIQTEMLKNNPNAIWVLQAWQSNPKNEFLKGLRKDRTIIEDICAEYYMPWKKRNGFENLNWIGGYVSNYGGNIGLQGRLKIVANLIDDVKEVPNAKSTFIGTGSFPEGIEQNPVLFDLGNEIRWFENKIDIERWISEYSVYRYGQQDENTKSAWHIFLNTAYGSYKDGRRTSVSVFDALPNMKGDKICAFGPCKINYDYRDYSKGVKLFVKSAEKFRNIETYRYDIVDFVRQYLDNLGKEEYYRFVESYNQKDFYGFEIHSKRFLELLLDTDKLLSSHKMFNLSRWLNFARQASRDVNNEDYYEKNARIIIGTWAETPIGIRDYAHRDYGGMLKDYYYPRWEKFIQKLSENHNIEFENGIEAKTNKTWVKNEYFDDEIKWINSHNKYTFDKEKDCVDLARQLYNKWENLL